MHLTSRQKLALTASLFLVGTSKGQTGANCNVPCDNYLSELQTVTELYDIGVNTIGAPLSDPTGSITSMCNISGNDIETCHQCSLGNRIDSQLALLNAWWQTCVTYQAYSQNIQSAYSCWRSIPSGSGSCYTGAGNDAHGTQADPWNYGFASAIAAFALFI